jgi:two-component system, cell cycle sensor histidine kinase and response regulator CckA
MGKPIRVLIVEDSEDDTLLVVGKLDRSGFQPVWKRVDTAESLRAALALEAWDIVISDHAMAGFGSLQALSVLQEAGVSVPFIIFSGVISEEEAVAAIRAGAADYISKDNLSRLIPVVERELRTARLRRGHEEIQKVQRENQARKNAILESALDCIITVDHEGRIFEWNRAAENAFGYRRADVLGKQMIELIIPPALRAQCRRGLSGYLAAGQSDLLGKRIEMTALRSDGTEFPVELTVTRVPVEGPPIFTGFFRDMTERRQLEEQLRQLQKMESIGQLAAGVAHDFNNILAVIQGHTYLLLGGLVAGQDAEESLKQIGAAAKRAASMTRQLLTFSRKQELQPQNLNLNEIVNGMAGMVGRLLDASIALEFLPAANAPLIHGDLSMMEQILLNLAVNARDAMPRGGQLTIRTAIRIFDDTEAHRNPEARAGTFTCLSVSDTGCGIPLDILPRIFEPFFTTKEAGKGTGLGLATVYGIVKQHQGWIEVESEVGRGTTFHVFFPSSSVAVAPPKETPASATPRGRGETILVAEDEPALRQLAVRVLRSLGYEVLEASSGVEAIQVWDQHGRKVDLLLTDLVMPDGLTGRDVAKKMQTQASGLKVIYTSGYTPDSSGTTFVFQEGANFLQKPCPPARLAQTVRRCLDGKTT